MSQITYASGVYCLRSEQYISVSIEKAWEFFSQPTQLEVMTPSDMHFNITSTDVAPMFEGQIITYRIQIFPLFSTNWVTEITHVEHQRAFVDEQRFGPYKMWHHRHSFTPRGNGVNMTDEIHFKLPLGCLGRLAYPIIVKPKLKKIFAFRRQKLMELFPGE